MSTWDDLPPLNTIEESEEMALHAAQIYGATHGLRLLEAVRVLNDELGRLASEVSQLAALRFYLASVDQMLPPKAEAPLLHSGVEKLRAGLRAIEEDGVD